MPTIRDVARQAGVSAGTVSNVLNRPSYVAPEKRRKVLEAIAELGYVPDASARQYRPGRQRTLGMVVVDLGNPFFVDVALGAENMAREAGAAFVVCNSGEDALREEYNLDMLVQQRVHGVMITPVDERNPRLGALLERGAPVVLLDRVAGDRHCCSVATNDVHGGQLAGLHLVEQGHRHVAFVGDPDASRQMADRHEGFVRGIGRTRCELVTASDFKLETGRSAGRAVAQMKASERPTGLFFVNDLLAIGALQELTRQGVRVPEDVAIVGYDDLMWAGAAAVPLSSVRQPRDQLGRTATRMVLAEIDEGAYHQHEHVVFQPELVIRASSDYRRGSARRRAKRPDTGAGGRVPRPAC